MKFLSVPWQVINSKYAAPWDTCASQMWCLYKYWHKRYGPMLKTMIWPIYIFDLWPWRMTMTMTHHHSKCAAPWDTHASQISKQFIEGWRKKSNLNKRLTCWRTCICIIDLWPWKMNMTFTNQLSKCASLCDTHSWHVWKQSIKRWRNKHNLTKR